MDTNRKTMDTRRQQGDIPQPERLTIADKLLLKILKNRLKKVLKRIEKTKKEDYTKIRTKLQKTVIASMELMEITETREGKTYEITEADIYTMDTPQLIRHAKDAVKAIRGVL